MGVVLRLCYGSFKRWKSLNDFITFIFYYDSTFHITFALRELFCKTLTRA